MSEWSEFESGRSLGDRGSEGGTIVLDDEHVDGARITIERGGHTAPFSITCGVYGCMVHTRFFSAELEARAQSDEMKRALSELLAQLAENDDSKSVGEACSQFVGRFP